MSNKAKKSMTSGEVEIQVTPMLDMAFQLLTFFIMTYRPAPSEVEFGMNLLPAQPTISANAPTTVDTTANDLPVGLKTLPTTLRAGGGGELAQITLGEKDIADLDGLRRELKDIVDSKEAFDQAVIQFDPHLKYAELIKVVDVFTQQKMTKLSFAELTADAPQ